MPLRRHRASRGQAAVETALTLPLVLFLILGTMQLFLLLQAKQMAQYAVFQATRVGSVTNGRCDAMTDAAILSLLPVLRSIISPAVAGATPGQKLGTVFGEFRTNDYGNFHGWSVGEPVVWLVRESPRFPGENPIKAQTHFDVPLGPGQNPVRLEMRMIFWCPLLVPFADWVFSRMMLAHYGLQPYGAINPLMVTQTANWAKTGTFVPQGEVATEYVRRTAMKHYVFPIDVSSTMRMMSPVQLSQFANPNCPGTPNTL